MKRGLWLLAATAVSLASSALADEPATKQKEIESRTVDSVIIGEEQNERDHNFKGEKTDARKAGDYMVRYADTNGWFSYDLKVRTNGTQYLNIQFGDGPGGLETAPLSVDIIVNGTNKLATEQISGGRGATEAANARSYALGAAMIRRGDIELKFQAPTSARTPAVASVRVMVPAPTIASMSKASSPRQTYAYIVNAVNDLRDPKSSHENINYDRNAKAHFDWWPAKATNTWVQYDFAKPMKISAVEAYWFDDSDRRGGCRPPKSWQLLYRQNGEWKPVANASGFGVELNRYNRTTFDAVETDGLKMDVVLPDANSSGLLQWKVE